MAADAPAGARRTPSAAATACCDRLGHARRPGRQGSCGARAAKPVAGTAACRRRCTRAAGTTSGSPAPWSSSAPPVAERHGDRARTATARERPRPGRAAAASRSRRGRHAAGASAAFGVTSRQPGTGGRAARVRVPDDRRAGSRRRARAAGAHGGDAAAVVARPARRRRRAPRPAGLPAGRRRPPGRRAPAVEPHQRPGPPRAPAPSRPSRRRGRRSDHRDARARASSAGQAAAGRRRRRRARSPASTSCPSPASSAAARAAPPGRSRATAPLDHRHRRVGAEPLGAPVEVAVEQRRHRRRRSRGHRTTSVRGRSARARQRVVHGGADQVHHDQVHLLHGRGASRRRRSAPRRPPSASGLGRGPVSAQTRRARAAGRLGGGDQVRAAARRGQQHEHVARPTVRPHLAGEALVGAVVVGDRSQARGLGVQADGAAAGRARRGSGRPARR